LTEEREKKEEKKERLRLLCAFLADRCNNRHDKRVPDKATGNNERMQKY